MEGRTKCLESVDSCDILSFVSLDALDRHLEQGNWSLYPAIE